MKNSAARPSRGLQRSRLRNLADRRRGQYRYRIPRVDAGILILFIRLKTIAGDLFAKNLQFLCGAFCRDEQRRADENEYQIGEKIRSGRWRAETIEITVATEKWRDSRSRNRYIYREVSLSKIPPLFHFAGLPLIGTTRMLWKKVGVRVSKSSRSRRGKIDAARRDTLFSVGNIHKSPYSPPRAFSCPSLIYA